MTTSILKTAGSPVDIQLTADKSVLSPNGQDLSYISVALVDAEGSISPVADDLVHFDVSGEGTLIAVANSNPMSTESFRTTYRKAWRGNCLAILKSGKRQVAFI